MNKHHVTYIKLAPYLASYWRHEMSLKSDEPLILPILEAKMYLYPFLRENRSVNRKKSKNKKGYYKDANSYSQYAYNVAIKGHDTIIPEGDKIPTIMECIKLQPFAIPDTLMRDKVKITTNEFYEVHDDGVKEIRKHIRAAFYSELHTHVVENIKRARRHGKEPNVKLYIDTWLYGLDIISDDVDANHEIEEDIRRMLYDYDDKNFSGDPDSIRRAHQFEIKKRNLPNLPRSQRFSDK